jgi:uncharacterized protein (TIGR02594 family)
MNPKYYSIGLLELGTKEVPGPKSNDRILEYHQATGLKASNEEVPWCGAFVAWCCLKAGIKYRSGTAARARDWLQWGKEIKWKRTDKHTDDVPIGAVGVIPRGKQGSGQGHVFMFHAWVDGTERKQFWALEGNVSNQVQIGKHNTDEVLGWRWAEELDFPVANQALKDSGIIKVGAGAVVAGATAVGGSATEVFDAVAKAKSISGGSIVAMVFASLVVIAVIVMVIQRANQKKAEKAIGASQAE